jgi:ABC-type multidrug transport system fused ATPase/permease subunit
MTNDSKVQQPDTDKVEMIPYGYFFRYCRLKEKIMLTLGSIALVLAGGFVPSLSLLYGQLISSFNPTNTGAETYEIMAWVAKWTTVIGCGELAVGYLYYALWQHVACNLTYDLRNRYVRKLLTMEVAFFEK